MPVNDLDDIVGAIGVPTDTENVVSSQPVYFRNLDSTIQWRLIAAEKMAGVLESEGGGGRELVEAYRARRDQVNRAAKNEPTEEESMTSDTPTGEAKQPQRDVDAETGAA
jgi:hypothetical protein